VTLPPSLGLPSSVARCWPSVVTVVFLVELLLPPPQAAQTGP